MSGFLNPGDWIHLQSDPTESSIPKAKPVDPYLWWLDSTGYRALSRDGALPIEFSFIAEGDSQAFKAALQETELARLTVIEPMYDNPLPNNTRSRFWTLRLNVDGLNNPQINTLLLALIRAKYVDRLQMGFARGPSGVPTATPVKAPPRETAPSQPSEKITASVVIGVIDDGCVFAHRLLRKNSLLAETRVAAIWNQSTFDKNFAPAAGCTWNRPLFYNYGAVTTSYWLDQLMQMPALQDGDGGPDELACYQTYWAERNRGMGGRESHGAAITTIAAGSLNNGSDAASTAPIIFVDLPLEQVEISSGRWMPVNGLDAMRFIVDRARATHSRKNTKETLPVVINLSSGSNAGAHDGTAMLERAMDELLAADDYLAITLAAGNSRLSESHCTCLVPPAHGANEIRVFLPHAKKFETYVEVWLPKNWSAQDLACIQFSLQSPDGRVSSPVGLNHADFFIKGAERIAGLHFCREVVQSTGRAMLLVAVAATSAHPVRPYAMGGRWRIKVVNTHASKPLQLDAWIERDEVVFGARRSQMARFFDNASAGEPQLAWDESGARTVRREGSLSSIASGSLSFAVAAGTGAKATGFASSYSGAPLAGSASPAFVARADRSPAQPGILVNGTARGALRHINGTSVAAPQAARWLANEMALGSTRPGIAAALPATVARLHPHTGTPASHDGRLFVGFP
jgi:hypothetical protein